LGSDEPDLPVARGLGRLLLRGSRRRRRAPGGSRRRPRLPPWPRAEAAQPLDARSDVAEAAVLGYHLLVLLERFFLAPQRLQHGTQLVSQGPPRLGEQLLQLDAVLQILHRRFRVAPLD